MFNVFSWQYFIYLTLAIGIIVALVLVLRKLNDKARVISQISLIACIGLFFIIEYTSRLIVNKGTKFGDQMPIELFQIFVYLSIFIFFYKKSSWKKFAYLIIASVSGYNLIFVPSMYNQFNAFSLCIISYYILNAVVLANAVLGMLWNEEDLEKKDVLDASITYIIIVAIAHLFNVFMRFTAWGVHANYFGTMGEGYDILIEWLYSIIPIPFLCILPLLAILVGVQFLLILPFDLIKTKKQKQSQIEELIALGNLKAQQEYRQKHKSTKSQILVKSETKAQPKTEKNLSQSKNSGFVATTKEVKVNKNKDKQ